MPADPDARTWIAALRASHDRLAARVAELDDGQLAAQSMCADWNIAQVLSHVGSGAEIGLGMLDASVAGRDLPGNDANTVIWDRWNAMTPREMTTAFAAADATLVEAFEALTAEQLADVQVRMPFLPEPIDVAAAAGFRLAEHALHTWDVFAALDPTARLAPDAAALLVDRLPMMVGFVGRFTPRETRPEKGVTLSVTTADPARQYELELGDSLDLRPAAPDGATDGELRLPAEALVRLTAGRLGPGTASGDVAPSGPLSLDGLRAAFPGY